MKGKKVYVALASGSFYSTKTTQMLDFAEPYLRTLLGFLGLTDVSVFRVEGTAIPNPEETALEIAIAEIAL